jgi:hypothetical protein
MNLSLVPLKNNILVDFKRNEIKTLIINRLRELNLDPAKYKLDVEYLTLVCNLIEHLVHKKDKIEKKKLVVEIFNEILGGNLSQEEINAIENNIEFIFQNKNIKKVSYYKMFKTGLSEWFKKK